MNNDIIAEDKLDKMINDLNMANDDFVNNYFDDEDDSETKLDENIIDNQEQSIEYAEETEINTNETYEEPENIDEINVEIQEENYDSNIEEKSIFSYNQILDRLDKKINLDNPDDILELIDLSKTADELFENLDREKNND